MSAENCGGLIGGKLKKFDDLCMCVKDKDKDAKRVEEARRKIDEKISKQEKKDPKNAFDLWKRCCDNTEHKKGCYAVGLFYLRGEVVRRNGIEAAKYFRWAVENGNAAGLRGLRRLYDEGYIDVKEDGSEEVFVDPKKEYKNSRSYKKGFEAIRRAAEEMNNRDAMIHLAFDYYENGFPEIVEPDLDKAIFWVKKATEGEEGVPFVERAALFAGRLFKLDMVKSYDLYACLLDVHFGTVVKVVRPDVLKKLGRYFFEKGGRERVIADRIRGYLKTLPRCSNCGLYGHITRDCEYGGRVCYYCHRSGHIARNCPKLAKK